MGKGGEWWNKSRNDGVRERVGDRWGSVMFDGLFLTKRFKSTTHSLFSVVGHWIVFPFSHMPRKRQVPFLKFLVLTRLSLTAEKRTIYQSSRMVGRGERRYGRIVWKGDGSCVERLWESEKQGDGEWGWGRVESKNC